MLRMARMTANYADTPMIGMTPNHTNIRFIR
jgi:hypothetical protein